MNSEQLEKFFTNGILVDSSVKDASLDDVDSAIKALRDKGQFILDSNTLRELSPMPAGDNDASVEILKNYDGETSPSKPGDWINYFNDRFNRLKNILLARLDARDVMSLDTAKAAPTNSDVKVIAMVSSVSISPIKKYLILDLEDNTSSFRAISPVVNQDIMKDQVLAIKGKKLKDAIFVTEIIFPDITIKDPKPLDIPDSYVAFLSDVHVGSKLFAAKQFDMFLKWIRGEEEAFSSIAKAVKFVVIIGDLVDGIGVYPDQEKELDTVDLREQYERLSILLDKIPKYIKLVILQGNHDATHIAEPQPKVDQNFGGSLYKLKNATFLSNPSEVNLKVQEGKRSVLLYHGFSIPYYADTISKYNAMNPEDIAAIMRLHLKSRHLAPTHGSSQIMPIKRDYLVIDDTPDVYATGHIHKTLVSKYRETVLINSSCWQFQTPYQKKYGQEPEVAKVPILNLRDKSFQILDFLGEHVQSYNKGVKPNIQ